jgi:hypothetical protein
MCLGGLLRNARSEGLDRPVVRMSNTYIVVPVSDGSPHLLVAEATVGGAG